MQKGLIQRILHRLKTPYRLVILNHETYKEVGSYHLNLLNVYTLLSMLIVLGALLVTLLLFYTPIKRMIPGYGTSANYGGIQKKLQNLENEVSDQRIYITKLQKLINGDVEIPNMDQINKPVLAIPNNQAPVPKSKEEIALEDELLVEKQIASVKNINLTNVSRYKPIDQLYFIAPVQGEISEHMSAQGRHNGIDIIVPKNTDVKCIMDGHIISADWTQETGNTLVIQHENDIISVYKHNSKLLKSAGDFVKAGEAVAIAGNSGEQTTGPHLHFEMWHHGKPVNPEDHIRF